MASDLIVAPMDHFMELTVHSGMVGITIGQEIFTDFTMLGILLLILEVMSAAAKTFDLGIKWDKTKIQTTMACCLANYFQQPQRNTVEVLTILDTFTYLGSRTIPNGSSELEIKHRIAVARSCITSLDNHILLLLRYTFN